MQTSHLKEATRSFSFRMGALLFLTLCAALMTFRVIIYFESVNAAYADTQAVIEAHGQDIEAGVTRYGIRYVKGLIDATLKDPQDPRFFIALKDDLKVTGNLTEWPLVENSRATWQEVSIPQGLAKKPLRLLVKLIPFSKKTVLLIGYDLYRIDIARSGLLEDIAENVLISLIVSFLLSVVIVWLINRQFLKINRTCEDVIQGKISRRVPVQSADDQFDQLGLNINKMLDWITTLLGTVRDSSNAVAHDMRTPLSFHRLELQALSENPDVPRPVQDKMRAAVGRVDALVGMFDNILVISKAESRAGTELFETFDIAEAARDIVAFYAPLFEEKNLTLDENIPASPLPFTGDEQLVKQAFVNLIDNAIKYTPEGGRIGVRVTTEGVRVTVTVSDDGPGIPPELREKVKERFFRLDKSRNTAGAGLGLSLVDAVARLHQGTFTLEDNKPGLVAALSLPVTQKGA